MKTAIRIFEIGVWVIAYGCLVWPPFDLSMGYFQAADGGLFWSALWGTVINVVIFYGNSRFLMVRYLAAGRRVQYFSRLGFIFLGFSAIEVLFDYLLLEYLGRGVSILDSELIGMVISFNFLFLFLSFGYGFFRIWVIDNQKKKDLEREKLSAELNFLRNQINPHFLFNTLNNLFAMSRKSGDMATASQLSRLAGMMRYMLYETNTNRVSMLKEIEYLQNYIEMQRMRFNDEDPIKLEFKWPQHMESVKIAPFLFIPFIENAFQYGISLSKESFIKSDLAVEGGVVNFSIENSIHSSNSKGVGGIGLANARQRLSLIYPDRHELKIENSEGVFHVQIRIDCNEAKD